MISNIDSAFVVWNTLISLGEQMPYDKESDSDNRSDAFNMCYMFQGEDPLEVNSDSELDEDVDMPYDELALFCQQLLVGSIFKQYKH